MVLAMLEQGGCIHHEEEELFNPAEKESSPRGTGNKKKTNHRDHWMLTTRVYCLSFIFFFYYIESYSKVLNAP